MKGVDNGGFLGYLLCMVSVWCWEVVFSLGLLRFCLVMLFEFTRFCFVWYSVFLKSWFVCCINFLIVMCYILLSILTGVLIKVLVFVIPSGVSKLLTVPGVNVMCTEMWLVVGFHVVCLTFSFWFSWLMTLHTCIFDWLMWSREILLLFCDWLEVSILIFGPCFFRSCGCLSCLFTFLFWLLWVFITTHLFTGHCDSSANCIFS